MLGSSLLLGLCVILTPDLRGNGDAAAAERPGACVPAIADRELAFQAHRTAPHATRAPLAPLLGQDDFDVLDYELSLFLDLAGERIEGSSAVRFTPSPGVASLAELVLDLHDGNLAVTAVRYDGNPVPPAQVSHAANSLRIALVPPLLAGATATVVVDYTGTPAELGFGTLTFDTHGTPPEPVIFTLSEPFLGRGWWPSKDVPDDKATVTTHVEAPDALEVAGNGVETGRVAGRPGHTVTTWQESHPISTYLVAVSASNYATWEDTYSGLSGTPMPVRFWSYPETLTAARTDWAGTVGMIETFARAFYEYPFLDEKYGHVMVPLWGAMEHQTATSYGAQLVTGDHRFDFVVAHELAHQWWGDHVGPRTFDSIWLNEGFATWSEALWWEDGHGLSGYLDYMASLDPLPTQGSDFPGTVHAPDDYFNATVYRKGGWVLHMLRWVLSAPGTAPDGLLGVLRAHGAAHPYASAETLDFAATASSFAGQDLSWFFDQWVFRPGRPDYGVGWAAAPQAGGGFVLHLRIEQRQPDLYRMPVLVRMTLPSGTREELVWNEAAVSDYSWPLTEAPTAVTWDEDGWVLKQVGTLRVDGDGDGWPDWLDGCPDVYNPGQEDLDLDGVQDACQPGIDHDGDGVLNENDCAPANPGAWSSPPDTTVLFVTRDPSGTVRLSSLHPDPQGQDPYLTDLSGGELAALRASGTYAGALCLVPGSAEVEIADPSPPGDRYFVAHPWNGCGPSEPGGQASSPCRR
jgi:aminopeptidase N